MDEAVTASSDAAPSWTDARDGDWLGSKHQGHALECFGSGRPEAGESYRLAPVVPGNSLVRGNTVVTAEAMVGSEPRGPASAARKKRPQLRYGD